MLCPSRVWFGAALPPPSHLESPHSLHRDGRVVAAPWVTPASSSPLLGQEEALCAWNEMGFEIPSTPTHSWLQNRSQEEQAPTTLRLGSPDQALHSPPTPLPPPTCSKRGDPASSAPSLPPSAPQPCHPTAGHALVSGNSSIGTK